MVNTIIPFPYRSCNNMDYPDRVKIYPKLAFICQGYKGYGGAFRLYAFVRALDTAGMGKIDRNAARDYIVSLGVSERTFRRWVKVAVEIGIIREIQKRVGGWWLVYVNMAEAAFKLGAHEQIGGRPIFVDAHELAGREWHIEAWSAYLTTTQCRPISRRVMRDITGMAECTQRRYERKAGTQKRANYHVFEYLDATHLDGFKEFEHGGVFVHKLKDGRKVIAVRGPNIYLGNYEEIGRKGNSRKVNKRIRQFVSAMDDDSLPTTRQTLNYGSLRRNQDRRERLPRLYTETPKSCEKSWKSASRLEYPPNRLYLLDEVREKSNFWKVIPTV